MKIESRLRRLKETHPFIMYIYLHDQNFFKKIATIVVAVATIVVDQIATYVVAVATNVFFCDNCDWCCDNCEHCENCDHIRPKKSIF